MLIELGSAILNKIFAKLLDELFPDKTVSNTKEIEWEIGFSLDGLKIKYNSKRIELNNNQIKKLINDTNLNKKFDYLRKDIISASNISGMPNYTVRTLGDKHSLEPAFQGSIIFEDNYTWDDVYKKAFLRKESIAVEKISFKTTNPVMKKQVEQLEKQMRNKKNMTFTIVEPPVDIISCSIVFESASHRNQQFYNIPTELSLYDYNEKNVTYKNHLQSNPLLDIALILPLNKYIDDVQFTYSLTTEGNKDIDALIMINTLERLILNRMLIMKIKDLVSDEVIFSGTIPQTRMESNEKSNALIEEMRVLEIIKKTELYFKVKLTVNNDFTKDDVTALDTLDILFSNRKEKFKASGRTLLTIKPRSNMGVIAPINGKLTITNDIKLNLFNTEIKDITQVINLYNVKEIGYNARNRERLKDGSLRIILGQRGLGLVEKTYIKTQDLNKIIKNQS